MPKTPRPETGAESVPTSRSEWLRLGGRAVRWRHLGGLLLAALLAALWTGWPLESLVYRFQLTRSGPRGVYQFVGGAIERGDWVAVCLPEPIAIYGRQRGYLGSGVCSGDVRPVLKRVVALGGDTVEVGDLVWVDGVAVAGSVRQTHDQHGRTVEAITTGTYVLGAAELWLATPAVDGWDSRYFGPIDRRFALAVAEPRLLLPQVKGGG